MPCQEQKAIPERSLEDVDIEGCIKTIEGLLKKSVSEEDRGALEVMLVTAVEERHRRQQVDLDTLMSKYGLSQKGIATDEVINVDDSPPASPTSASSVLMMTKLKTKVAGSKIAPKNCLPPLFLLRQRRGPAL